MNLVTLRLSSEVRNGRKERIKVVVNACGGEGARRYTQSFLQGDSQAPDH